MNTSHVIYPANKPASTFVNASERVYRILLYGYPAGFRRRFGKELFQVFHANCREAHQSAGNSGILRLWPPILWDWILTAAREQLSNIFGRFGMNDLYDFDRQLGDAVWMLTTGLYAGYSLNQVIQALVAETPEPVASAFRRLHDDLEAGLSLDEACANLKKAIPSTHLAEVLAVIQKQLQTGGNLADLLAPVGEKIVQQAGSDPALYTAMRRQAEQLGAQAPERAK